MEQRLPSLTVLANLSSIVCDFFNELRWFLSVNPEKSQGELDRQKVFCSGYKDVGPELIVQQVSDLIFCVVKEH